GFDHRVLAADLVGEDGYLEPLLHPADDVEVWQAGLDHHAVRPFGQVERDFAQRLFAVGRIHLVSLLVALEQTARADSVPEWTVERARVFRRIAHDLNVGVALRLERRADRPNTPVHHIARCNDIGPRTGLIKRLIDKCRNWFVVGDIAGIVEQAVLPVARIGVERDVGQHADIQPAGIAYRPDCAAP